MAEQLLIDLGDGPDGAVDAQPILEKKNYAQESVAITTDLAGASLIPGFGIKISVKDTPDYSTSCSSHSEGISVGFDKINNVFIISQQPQVPDSSTHLRLSISLSDITITDNQGRVITGNSIKRTDISTLFIKASAAFKQEIIHASQNKLQQSQDRGPIDLMCSISSTYLPKGTILDVSEVYKDLGREKQAGETGGEARQREDE